MVKYGFAALVATASLWAGSANATIYDLFQRAEYTTGIAPNGWFDTSGCGTSLSDNFLCSPQPDGRLAVHYVTSRGVQFTVNLTFDAATAALESNGGQHLTWDAASGLPSPILAGEWRANFESVLATRDLTEATHLDLAYFPLPGGGTPANLFMQMSGPSFTLFAFEVGPGCCSQAGEYNDGTYTGRDTFGGTGTFALTPRTAIPEPATWVLMIGGFGLAGSFLRRRLFRGV